MRPANVALQRLLPTRPGEGWHQLLHRLAAQKLGKQDHRVEKGHAGDQTRSERRDLERNRAPQAVPAQHGPIDACGATYRADIVCKVNDAKALRRHPALPATAQVEGDHAMLRSQVVEHRREVRAPSERRVDQDHRRIASSRRISSKRIESSTACR